MRPFSFRPTPTFKRREFKGLRGLSGKPLHPPLTDAYMIAAAFDVISFVGNHTAWQEELYRAPRSSSSPALWAPSLRS